MRKKRGEETLAQSARKPGILDSTLQRLEIGEQNITFDVLELIIDRLKCSVAEVFDDTKE